MTIDEAIALYTQRADSYKNTVPECDVAQDNRQLAEWLTELKELREKYREVVMEGEKLNADYTEQVALNEQYKKREEQYKRLLKLAVEDNKCVLRENFGDICQFCKHYSNSEALCRKPHNGSGSWCCENAEWRYANESLALIGETNDEP